MRRTLLATAIVSVALAAAPSPSAQNWPTRSIRVIVPLTAGAATDIMARAVFEQVSQQLGQPMIVENRPGAGNTIGMAAVAAAEPDGYTILANSSTHTVSPATRSKLTFNVLTDLSGVIPLGNMPVVMAVNPKKGYKTLADFVNYARKNPGAINYAIRRRRQLLASERRALPDRGKIRGRARAAARRARGADRGDRGPARLLFRAAAQRHDLPEAGAAAGARRVRLAARLRAARRADHGRGRLSQLRVQFLGRRVPAGQDAATRSAAGCMPSSSRRSRARRSPSGSRNSAPIRC